jgi:hypothetical protein
VPEPQPQPDPDPKQASHCIDFPKEVNGTLDRVVFGADMFDKSAPTSKVAPP